MKEGTGWDCELEFVLVGHVILSGKYNGMAHMLSSIRDHSCPRAHVFIRCTSDLVSFRRLVEDYARFNQPKSFYEGWSVSDRCGAETTALDESTD